MAASKFNKCVGRKLRGKHFRTKTAQKKALKRAIRACGGKVGKKTRAHKRYRRAKKCSVPAYRKCIARCQRTHGHCIGGM